MNWHQIWEVASAPDNVPIVALLFLVPFYVWYAFRQALENDRLIDKLSADPALAKTEYRKTEPWSALLDEGLADGRPLHELRDLVPRT